MAEINSNENTGLESLADQKIYTWPNPIFPFRVYFDSPECRIFIIENLTHNYNWLKEYSDYIKPTDYFFVICGWYHDEYLVKLSSQMFKALGLNKENFFILFNSEKEKSVFEGEGFIGEIINQNCWLDSNFVKPVKANKFFNIPVRKRYDAVYVARRSVFKRHYLADKVDNLALITGGNNYGHELCELPKNPKYISDKQLSPKEVFLKMSESRCGLMLSDKEGACFTSGEYLLCGIPVVSTPSVGGRDEWYNNYNSIICEPNAESVANAVRYFASNPRKSRTIRNEHIKKAKAYRKLFINQLQKVFVKYGVNLRAKRYFRDNFMHKMRHPHKPDFKNIFITGDEENTNKYLIVKGINGMANRIFTLLEAIVYAKATKRKLVVDWRDGIYSDGSINSFHELFETEFMETLGSGEDNSFCPEVWKGNLHLDVDSMVSKNSDKNLSDGQVIKKYSIDLSREDYSQDFLVATDYFFDFEKIKKYLKLIPDSWPAQKDDLIKFLLKKYLFIKKDIKDRVDSFKTNNFKNKVIGVHIRYTDNMHGKYEHYKSIDLDGYFPVIDEIIKKNNDYTIFLATDNKDVVTLFKNKYRNVVYADKYFAEGGSPIHFSKSCKKIDMARESLVDLYLLSLCNCLVYNSVSSYARLAVYLSNADKKDFFDLNHKNEAL